MTKQSMTPEEYREQALRLVSAFIPSMRPGHPYTAETMCGIAFWKGLPHGMPSLVGDTIALAVEHKMFNLRLAYKGTDDKNRYALLYDEPEQESETDIDPKSIKPCKRKSK